MPSYIGVQTAKEGGSTVKKAKKTGRRPNFITMLVLMVLLAVMAIELVQVYGKLHTARREQTSLSAQIQQLQQENEALESDLSRADDEDFIMELARTQLGLAESGERIFYDVND